MSDTHAEVIRKLVRNPVLAHRTLFRHRHRQAPPVFEHEIIEDWHSAHPKIIHVGFRGCAKTTVGEEASIIEAALRRFKNGLLLGSNSDMAAERLTAIKHEVETNEALLQIFGDLRGEPWSDDEIVLSNGVRIKAFGRGQAMRGTKYLDMRPDFVFADDIEYEKNFRSIEILEDTRRWLFTEVIPALDTDARIRMNATRQDPGSLPVILGQSVSTGWLKRVYSIEYIGANGERVASWADRFPLTKIDEMAGQFAAVGMAREFDMEYRCKTIRQEDKPFKKEMLRIEPQVRTHHPAYLLFDPARTIKGTSAQTGFVACSWVANRLVVWEAWGKNLLPDEIISEIFRLAQLYNPVWIGLDKVGLEEFLLQPIRQQQIKRGFTIPIKPLSPPKAKSERIRALQPFFAAREVWFSGAMDQLEAQLLNYPEGNLRDVVDALAYALYVRPGAPIHDSFSFDHIAEDLQIDWAKPAWLALNAEPACTTAALMQLIGGALRVFADWVVEGPPGEVATSIIQEAQLVAAKPVKLYAPPVHFGKMGHVGLSQAVRRIPMELARGAAPEIGVGEMRLLLGKSSRGTPAFLVSAKARWTLNALAGGYCRVLTKQGVLADYAEEGPYRTLMEGIESFVGTLRMGLPEESGNGNYASTPDGRQYLSSLPRRS